MTYEIGDRVRLKDDGDTNFIIVSTKEMSVGNKGLGIFDYEIKRIAKKRRESTSGRYSRKAFTGYDIQSMALTYTVRLFSRSNIYCK